MKRDMLNNRLYMEKNGDFIENPQWLTIFNDLITLLMVFFVLLFSLGSMNFQRFHNFQNALQSAMGVMHGGRSGENAIISETGKKNPEYGSQDNDAGEQPEPVQPMENLNPLIEMAGFEAEYTPKGIQLVLDDQLLFPSGSAQISTEGIQLLEEIGKVIKPFNRFIRVEGHTDDIPIETRRYPSNWELSMARAVNVVKFFIEKTGLSPAILSAAGYGSSRPRAGNDTTKDRAKNRRVEIIMAQPIPSSANQAKPDNGGK